MKTIRMTRDFPVQPDSNGRPEPVETWRAGEVRDVPDQLADDLINSAQAAVDVKAEEAEAKAAANEANKKGK